MHDTTLHKLLLGLISSDPVFTNNQGIFKTVDWTRLVEIAYQHGVNGLLCRGLLQQREGGVPVDIAEACDLHMKSCADHNQKLADQLSNILGVLSSRGIPVIPFKGPVLAMKAYGDLSLRSFRDLDFLIHHGQIEVVLSLLRELGYHNEHGLSPRQWQAFKNYAGQDIMFGEGVPVEPHWQFAPSTLALNVDYDSLWQRVVSYQFNDQIVQSLVPEDELIVLCLHGAKEKWSKLKWVVDVAKFVNVHASLDWGVVFRRSESQGVARIVRLALSISQQLLSLSLPDQVVRWLNKDVVAGEWAKQIATDFFNPGQEDISIYKLSYFHWKMRERIRDKVKYLARTVAQPRVQHFSSIKIPDSMFVAYYPFKLLHDYMALPVWKLLKGTYK